MKAWSEWLLGSHAHEIGMATQLYENPMINPLRDPQIKTL
jgi:hypothetical protein